MLNNKKKMGKISITQIYILSAMLLTLNLFTLIYSWHTYLDRADGQEKIQPKLDNFDNSVMRVASNFVPDGRVVDGVRLDDGERALVFNSETGHDGIYVMKDGRLTRDLKDGYPVPVIEGYEYFVKEGETHKGTCQTKIGKSFQDPFDNVFKLTEAKPHSTLLYNSDRIQWVDEINREEIDRVEDKFKLGRKLFVSIQTMSNDEVAQVNNINNATMTTNAFNTASRLDGGWSTAWPFWFAQTQDIHSQSSPTFVNLTATTLHVDYLTLMPNSGQLTSIFQPDATSLRFNQSGATHAVTFSNTTSNVNVVVDRFNDIDLTSFYNEVVADLANGLATFTNADVIQMQSLVPITGTEWESVGNLNGGVVITATQMGYIAGMDQAMGQDSNIVNTVNVTGGTFTTGDDGKAESQPQVTASTNGEFVRLRYSTLNNNTYAYKLVHQVDDGVVFQREDAGGTTDVVTFGAVVKIHNLLSSVDGVSLTNANWQRFQSLTQNYGGSGIFQTPTLTLTSSAQTEILTLTAESGTLGGKMTLKGNNSGIYTWSMQPSGTDMVVTSNAHMQWRIKNDSTGLWTFKVDSGNSGRKIDFYTGVYIEADEHLSFHALDGFDFESGSSVPDSTQNFSINSAGIFIVNAYDANVGGALKFVKNDSDSDFTIQNYQTSTRFLSDSASNTRFTVSVTSSNREVHMDGYISSIAGTSYTLAEWSQVQKIGTTLITNAHWSKASTMQSIGTSDSPQFGAVQVNGDLSVAGTISTVDVSDLKTDFDTFKLNMVLNWTNDIISQLQNIPVAPANVIGAGQYAILSSMPELQQTNSVILQGLTVTGNVTGTTFNNADLGAINTTLGTYNTNAKNPDLAEIVYFKNIPRVITSSEWTKMSVMQDHTSQSNVTFGGLTCGSLNMQETKTIDGVDIDVLNTDLQSFLVASVNDLTQHVINQLENINSSTITDVQWDRLNRLQYMDSASSPTFDTLNMDNGSCNQLYLPTGHYTSGIFMMDGSSYSCAFTSSYRSNFGGGSCGCVRFVSDGNGDQWGTMFGSNDEDSWWLRNDGSFLVRQATTSVTSKLESKHFRILNKVADQKMNTSLLTIMNLEVKDPYKHVPTSSVTLDFDGLALREWCMSRGMTKLSGISTTVSDISEPDNSVGMPWSGCIFDPINVRWYVHGTGELNNVMRFINQTGAIGSILFAWPPYTFSFDSPASCYHEALKRIYFISSSWIIIIDLVTGFITVPDIAGITYANSVTSCFYDPLRERICYVITGFLATLESMYYLDNQDVIHNEPCPHVGDYPDFALGDYRHGFYDPFNDQYLHLPRNPGWPIKRMSHLLDDWKTDIIGGNLGGFGGYFYAPILRRFYFVPFEHANESQWMYFDPVSNQTVLYNHNLSLPAGYGFLGGKYDVGLNKGFMSIHCKAAGNKNEIIVYLDGWTGKWYTIDTQADIYNDKNRSGLLGSSIMGQINFLSRLDQSTLAITTENPYYDVEMEASYLFNHNL